jgi:lysophospholipase L1-like esterase
MPVPTASSMPAGPTDGEQIHISTARRFSALFALTFSSLCVVLFLCEIAIRLVSPQDLGYFDSRTFRRVDPTPPHFVENIPGGRANFIGVPVTINSLGLRGVEIVTPKPPGRVRLLAVGDSITFGYGVRNEDTYANVLETLLNQNKKSESQYEVLNGGTLGGSLEDYLHFLQQKSATLQPDVILIGLCLNDILVYQNAAQSDSLPALPPKPRPARSFSPRQLNYFLLRHSQLYVVLYSDLKALAYRTGLLHLTRAQSLVALEPPSGHQARAWQSSLAMLSRIADFCKQHGYRLIVVAFPMQMQMSPAEFTFYRDRYHLNLADATLSGAPQQILHDYAAANGIALVDLLPAYRSFNPKEIYLRNRMIPSDPVHPSVKGHQIAAEEIFRATNTSYSSANLRHPEALRLYQRGEGSPSSSSRCRHNSNAG